MGYELVTYCPTCGEPNDVYMPPENRFCSEECETAMKDVARCELCGEPMPEGETMFKYHGHSGPCPKPPPPRGEAVGYIGQAVTHLRRLRRIEVAAACLVNEIREHGIHESWKELADALGET